MSPLSSNFDIVFLTGILTASLVGSAHCIGMCGGLVLAATQPPESEIQSHSVSGRKKNFILFIYQVLYHGARLISYLLIGGVAGLIGGSLLSHQVSLYLSIFATISVAVIFIYTGIQVFKGGKLNTPLDQFFSKLSMKIFPKINKITGFFRPVVTGLATGLLPCAWLYSFVMMSVATKSPLKGAMVLAAFWLGTVPALSFGALLVQKLLTSFHVRAYRIVGVVLVFLGIWTLYARATHISFSESGSVHSDKSHFDGSHAGERSCHE